MTAEQHGPRISPFTYLKEYVLPGCPVGASQAAADAHRQTKFLLGEDRALFERGMNLELRVVSGSRAARYRTPALVGVLGLWSRAFAYRHDVCSLVTQGSYMSCLPLLRVAADCIGAEQGLAGDERQEFLDWLSRAISQNKEHSALEIELGRYRAGGMVAADQRLGAVYRGATELSMPHFGATLLQAASEADQERVSIAFGEGHFHLGWAQLILGWLVTLTEAQLQTVTSAEGLFAVSEEIKVEVGRFSKSVGQALAQADRCWLEEVGDGRFLIRNFRRQARGAPRKILL